MKNIGGTNVLSSLPPFEMPRPVQPPNYLDDLTVPK